MSQSNSNENTPPLSPYFGNSAGSIN